MPSMIASLSVTGVVVVASRSPGTEYQALFRIRVEFIVGCSHPPRSDIRAVATHVGAEICETFIFGGVIFRIGHLLSFCSGG